MARKGRRFARIRAFFARYGRRIGRIAVCVLLAAALAVPVPFVNTVIGYAPLMAYLLVLLASFVYLQVLARRLTFDALGMGDGCYRGEKVPFKLAIDNRTILPAVSVSVEFTISDAFGGQGSTARKLVTLPPRARKDFDFGVRFDHIGTFQVGVSTVEVTDPFGIFHKQLQVDSLCDVHVRPVVRDIAGLDLSVDATSESKRSINSVINDGMDYNSVREYRWGDPLKAIHWKLSAGHSSDDYLTRLYETVTNPGLEVLVDFDSMDDYDAEDLMCANDAVVESAFSVMDWAADRGLETEIIFIDDSDRTRRFTGTKDDMGLEVLRRMPRMSAGSGRRLLDVLGQESASIYSQTNLVICTSCITEELVGAVISARLRKRNPILLAVVPANRGVEERETRTKALKRLGSAGIAYAVIGDAADLEGGR